MGNQVNDREQNQQILNLAKRLGMPRSKTAQEAWLEVSSKLTTNKSVIFLNPWMRVAASISLIFVVSVLAYKSQDVEVITSKAQHLNITLPDNSKVQLNAESKLEYNKLKWRAIRSLNFEGEGYFNVKNGSDFTVKSKNGTTQVLGTKFNIYARGAEYQVSCSSGRVRVSFLNETKQILTGGLETNNSQENPTVKPFEETKTLSWTKGEFYFESESLRKVFTTIERQYNVNISLEKIDLERRYTGFFTNRDIDEALKVVCLPMGLDFMFINSKNIKIYKEQNV